MTAPLFETPSVVTLPATEGPTPDGTVLGPSGTAGAVGNEKNTAGGTGEELPVTPTAPAHVIGLDVSLTATGVACTHGATLIRSSGKADATLPQRQQRIRHILERTYATIYDEGIDPDLIVIEAPSYNSRGGSSHDRSGLWWLLLDAFTQEGWPVVEIAPATRAKFATGRGNADKDAVLSAAIRRLPIGGIDNNNAADAGFLCAIGHDLLGQPICDLPALNRAAIDKHRPTVLPPAPKDA